jgi:hypothetical protein
MSTPQLTCPRCDAVLGLGKLAETAKADVFVAGSQSCGFVFDTDLVSIVRFLEIGTRVFQGAR